MERAPAQPETFWRARRSRVFNHAPANVESQDEPGQKVLVSSPLDEIKPPVSVDAFFEELVQYQRYPVETEAEQYVKECTVEEHGSEDVFTTKLIMDGAKLDSIRMGKKDGTDRVRSWKRITVDRENLIIVTEDFVPEPDLGAWADEVSDENLKNPVARTTTKVRRETSCVEFHVVLASGERKADDFIAKGVGYIIDLMVKRIHAAEGKDGKDGEAGGRRQKLGARIAKMMAM